MSTSVQQSTRNTVSLKGSVAMVTEFFGFAVNSILYQRGVYPPETFMQVPKYGLPLTVTKDDKLKAYLGQVLTQLAVWLGSGMVQRLVLLVNTAKTNATLERWTFDVSTTGEGDAGDRRKTEEQARAEIQAVMRQITASVSFLPMITEAVAFDLLVYTRPDCTIPETWETSDARLILEHSAEVKLRTFSTSFHKVDAAVTFRE